MSLVTPVTSAPGLASASSTGTRATRILGVAALAACIACATRGLTLAPTAEQGQHVRLIAIHPALAWTAYLAFGVTALTSALYLWPRTRSRLWDLAAGASAEIGVVITALVLVTGSVWGRPTWGVWWTWDARLTSTAIMAALFAGYLAVRRVPAPVEVRSRRAAVVGLMAALDIPIVHFSVEWWRTLHQGRSLARLDPGSALDGSYLAAMLLGILALSLVYAWLLIHRVRVELLEEHLEDRSLDLALEERRAEAELVP